MGGHFKLKLGGQYHWNLHTDNIEMRNKLYKYLQKDKWAFISKNDIGQETYTYKGFDIQLLFFTDDYNHTEIRIKK